MKRMPTSISSLLLISICFIFTCNKSEDVNNLNSGIDNSNIPTRLWSPNDENLNPDWDWTNPFDEYGNAKIYELYVENPFVGTIIYEKQLPYFTYDGGPAANDLNQSLDIMPEYGWELFGRDFGSVEDFNRYVKMPWFALYNRARGILRFFYFNTMSNDYTYGVATLSSCDGDEERIAIFNAFKQENASLDDYDDNIERNNWNGLECIHKIESLKWCYADFELSFDPDIIDDTNLIFNVYGINDSLVNLEGDITLIQFVETERVGTNLLHNLFNSGKKAIGYYKDAESALTEIENAKNNNKSSFKKILTKGIPIAAIAAYAGFVYNFISGMFTDQVVSMGYYGYFNVSGSILGRNDLDSFKINAPGSEITLVNNSYIPFYNKPMGIVSFVTKPKLGFKVNTIKECDCFDIPRDQHAQYVECGLIEPIQLKINYNKIQEEITHYNVRKNQNETYSFRVRSVEAAAVYADGKEPVFYKDTKVSKFEQNDAFYQHHNFWLDPVPFQTTHRPGYSRYDSTPYTNYFSDSLFYVGGDDDLYCPKFPIPNNDEDINNMITKIHIAIRILIEPIHTPSKYHNDGTYSSPATIPIEIIKVIRPEYIKNPTPTNNTLFTTPCDIPANLNGGVQINCCD